MGMSALDIVRKSHYGYYFIIIAAALAALVHVLSKPMLEVGTSQVEINPIVMAFLVYFICGIFFTPLVKKSPGISKVGRRDIMFMMLIGIAEGAGLITYFYGISTSTAVNASIFSNSEIIFALVIAMLVFKERLHIKECIPFSMIIIGMMIIPIGNDLYRNDFSLGSLVTGDLLIIFSGLLYAIDITLCKYLGERFDVKKTVQIISFTCAAITISIIVLFQIPMDIELAQVPNILLMSIAGTGMSTLFFLMGLKLIGAVRTVLLYSTTSVFGIIFSGVILSEIITYTDVISVILVLTGIFLLRNRLAETEDRELKQRTTHGTRTNHISFTKKNKKVSRVSKWIQNKIGEEIRQVFPNSGIG
ncbi:MAG: DMT family transporter [Nitrosarchaeum sp.]|nr:DMT family transporter [Nitrosarchaeum sp.]